MSDIVGYRRPGAGAQPAYLHPPYKSSVARAPALPPVAVPQTLSEVTGPLFADLAVGAHEADLTKGSAAPPQGERIIVQGRVLDQDNRPVPRTLVELWQCNAAGRYHHPLDQHDAPLDPNFHGFGRAVTDDDGFYRFVTIRPGAYPWRNHANAWRPAHIHFSLFGPSFLTRLVTQMYFPGDPLLPLDPIFNCVDDPVARDRMVAAFSLDATVPEFALGYVFDIVVRGREATPMEGDAP
ncbi:protocatechuate 3,4-dioxygenase beta subunit [Stella humosa]|uniref:Protocatechuate 3,4-dioxygenase beta subunit n=1 Tax=Stella humosa TaxID=94 RepID=A0A3N1L1W8_9PROT|nr:protocatechuate 3,4-dioxygenase subunit beta [Stella humosa]ROP84456.1 protocatechuate 3,4-dioxygenase beta subunit [Stella humosa]BBK33974.1 protocatechuate 3,4-dioxygenase subunit beta [Stella humosa]